MYPNRWWNLSLGVVALMSFTVALGGCNGFFVCEGKASCPTTVTETVTTDLAYVSNSTSGASYLNIYNLTNGTLAQISGSPFSLGYEPVAMAMAPSNGYLYVATLPGSTNPGVYGYSISSTGTLTALSSTALATDSVASMAISPDGNWLYTVSTTGQTMEQYSVNTSTGALSPNVGFNLSGSAGCALNTSGISAAVNQCMVKVSPTGDFVAVALGGSGVYTFSYSSANGITNAQAVGSIGTGSATVGYYSLTIDSNHYLYIGSTGTTNSLIVYSVSTSGVPGSSAVATETLSNGENPRSLVVTSGASYFYSGNLTTSTISTYAIGTNEALSAVGSEIVAPSSVSAIGIDNSGKYLVAAGLSGSNGVQLYSIGSSGGLSPQSPAATGTLNTVPTVMALTH